MRNNYLVLSLILAPVLVTMGCSSSTNSTPPDRPGLAALQVECNSSDLADDTDGPFIDPGMSNFDCSGIRTVYNGIRKAEISAQENSNFQKLFGGTNSESVVGFMNQRVHYIVPGTTNFAVRHTDGRREIMPWTREERIVALNAGMAMWLTIKRNAAQFPGMTFTLGRTPIDSTAPTSGVILLGRRFADFPLVDRMETMVHEARHSDCASVNDDLCGHPHSECPSDHELRGIHACDGRGIGPYFTGAVYSKTVGTTCANCSEKEKQIALASSLDSLNRVVNRDRIERGIEQGWVIDRVPGSSPKKHRDDLRTVHSSRKREMGR